MLENRLNALKFHLYIAKDSNSNCCWLTGRFLCSSSTFRKILKDTEFHLVRPRTHPFHNVVQGYIFTAYLLHTRPLLHEAWTFEKHVLRGLVAVCAGEFACPNLCKYLQVKVTPPMGPVV